MSVATVSGILNQMTTDITTLQGDVTTLQGQVANIPPMTLISLPIQGTQNHADGNITTLITTTPPSGTYILSGIVKVQSSDNTTSINSIIVQVNKAGNAVALFEVGPTGPTTTPYSLPRQTVAVPTMIIQFNGAQQLQIVVTVNTTGNPGPTYDIIGSGGAGNAYSSFAQLLKIGN